MQYGWKPSPASQSDRDEAFAELLLARVPAQDAEALADTLADALPDIPAHDALSHRDRGLVSDDRSAGGPYLNCPPGLFEGFLSRTDGWSRT